MPCLSISTIGIFVLRYVIGASPQEVCVGIVPMPMGCIVPSGYKSQPHTLSRPTRSVGHTRTSQKAPLH